MLDGWRAWALPWRDRSAASALAGTTGQQRLPGPQPQPGARVNVGYRM